MEANRPSQPSPAQPAIFSLPDEALCSIAQSGLALHFDAGADESKQRQEGAVDDGCRWDGGWKEPTSTVLLPCPVIIPRLLCLRVCIMDLHHHTMVATTMLEEGSDGGTDRR